MPVVDETGKLVGLLRDEDLIVSEARLHVPTFINFLGVAIPLAGSDDSTFEDELHKVAGATVADVMDDDPPTIGPDDTLEELATLMHERERHARPGRRRRRQAVVGIVARGDLVRFIARTHVDA